MASENIPSQSSEEPEVELSEEILAVGRRVYDELRHFVFIPEGMVNQIYRYGIMSKKTIDGGNTTRMHGSRNYWRDKRTVTPDGALIIHRDDLDPHPNNCDAFIHPPYGSKQQYRGEKDAAYSALVSFAKLAGSAQKCGFCSILYQGIYLKRNLWRSGWARYQWVSVHKDFDPVEAENQQPWSEQYQNEIECGKGINEDELGVDITFPKDKNCLIVRIGILNQSIPNQPSSEPKTTEDIRNSLQKEDRNRKICELEFYTAPDDPSPWAAFEPTPHIQPEVISKACIEKIWSWLKPCVLWHLACAETPWRQKSRLDSSHQTARSGRSRLSQIFHRITKHRRTQKKPDIDVDDGFPARLLKLEWSADESNPPVVRLEETTNPDAIYRYVALSHVWAFTTPCRTTRENYPDHQRQVPWVQLSLPLRQTIVLILSLQLNLEYLWIDSLCIVQDDLADKEKELPRMSLIYGRAEIVFAAHGPELGFDKAPLEPIRDPKRPDDPPVYCRQKINHENLFLTPRDPSSWLGRAWCMQERIFASRILHFGGSGEEIFFECNTLTDCECSGMRSDVGPDMLTFKGEITKAWASAKDQNYSISLCNELWKIYITACEDYTPRGVTFSSDKLSAVSSLMRTFMPYLGKYYAGLWEHNLILSLQWEAADTGLCKRHEEYVAPSFSWASISGKVIWYLDMKKIPIPVTHGFASVIDISCKLERNDPYGPVSGGHIALRGYITNMKIEESKLMLMPDGRLEMTKDGTESCYVTLDSKQDYERVEPGMTVKCLDIMRDKDGLHGNYISGLVLLPVDHDQRSRYCRIGFSTMSEEHFKDSTLETVTII